MAFLTLCTTHLGFGYACALAFLDLIMVFFKNVVVFVVGELHFSLAVTVDTPAHREWSELVNLIHFLDVAMAALALYLANLYVL